MNHAAYILLHDPLCTVMSTVVPVLAIAHPHAAHNSLQWAFHLRSRYRGACCQISDKHTLWQTRLEYYQQTVKHAIIFLVKFFS
jgi:hypothetical protein